MKLNETLNEQYFYCPKTLEYADAGYWWAYSSLIKTGICKVEHKVNIEKLQGTKEYWDIDDSEESRWVKDGALPLVSEFIERNRNFEIFYGEQDHFLDAGERYYWEWLDVGYKPDKSPRYFLEVLGFRSWSQVAEFVNGPGVHHFNKPWWWHIQPDHDEAKKFFEAKAT